MRTVTSFDDIPQNLTHPIAVTIGAYDGIHLGHQSIFKRLKELSQTSVVVTFSNHPSEVLNPQNPTKLIYSPEKKLALIETCGIDLTVLLTFTNETASNTYDQFLLSLQEKLPFDYLALGSNARLGKGRTGTPDVIQAFGKQHGFSAEYLTPKTHDGSIVSSSLIRSYIDAGDMSAVSQLLGRPYP